MMVDQDTFRAALFDAARARPEGLTDGTGAPAGRRFDVYRNNVAVSLTEALETAFPIIAKLVGGENFRVLAGAFLRTHPPSSPLMMHYGREMPDFLREFAPTARIGYLPDIARLEIALRESYHAADAEPLSSNRIGAIPPDALMAARVTLAPALRVVRSRWPIHTIWRFNTEPGAPKPAMAAENVSVFRPEYDPEPILLPTGAGAFLTALMHGTALGDAVDLATAESPEFDLTATLALLISKNAIIHIGDTP